METVRSRDPYFSDVRVTASSRRFRYKSTIEIFSNAHTSFVIVVPHPI